MLAHTYKKALGKSTRRQSLYDHTLSCVDVALRLAKLVGEQPGPRLDVLVFATFVHDVGKLDPDFQAMLEAAACRQPLPKKRVKHEASTFDHGHPQLIEESKESIRTEVRAACDYQLNLKNVASDTMDHVWAFTVTHHGFFYLSYERQKHGPLRPLIRREWISSYPNEERRITLVDLLFGYHPVGGLVIVADLIASFCHEQGLEYQGIFGRASEFTEVVTRLIDNAGDIERGIKRYDPRDYGLKEVLRLLMGGIR